MFKHAVMISYLRNTFLFAALACFAVSAFAEKLVLGGSDVIKPYISETLKTLAAKNRFEVETRMNGSYSAFDEMKSGATDAAIIALPKGASIPDGYAAYPFAYQVAVVIVNSVNPIEDISTNQLYRIFSKQTQNRAETWEQVGVKSSAVGSILAISTDFSDNVVVELFKYSAMKGTNLGPWVNIESNKQVIYNMVKANNSAIAIVGKLTDTNMLKVLAVSNSDGGKTGNYAFKPDANSIYNGDYPMVLPFYVVCPKDKLGKAKSLIKILLGDELAHKINATDFYSAPADSRKKSIFELDISK